MYSFDIIESGKGADIMKKCTLDKEINTCPFFDTPTENCNNLENCSMQQKEETKKHEYIRKPRWYEKYYQ